MSRVAVVHLDESWKISWYTTYGRMSAQTTGGTDLDGETSRHNVEWSPPAANREAKAVTFFIVTRDGRGGTSWLKRVVNYSP